MDSKRFFIMAVICSALSLLMILMFYLTTDSIIGKILFILIAVVSSIFYTYQGITYYKQFVKDRK